MWQEALFTLGLHSERKKPGNPEMMLMKNHYWQKKKNRLLNLYFFFYLSLNKCVIIEISIRDLKNSSLSLGCIDLKVSNISALFKRALLLDEIANRICYHFLHLIITIVLNHPTDVSHRYFLCIILFFKLNQFVAWLLLLKERSIIENLNE